MSTGKTSRDKHASNTNTKALLNIDQNHIWHPYSSIDGMQANYLVSSASGVRLTLSDGRQLIDGMASWWSAIHGYNHPQLNQAAQSQLAKMSHVMFGGLTHEAAIKLAQTLVNITPEGLNRVFFSDSGSVAVEVAIKMALQYWQARGNSKRTRILAFRKGYHGDTIGAMATCDPITGMHHIFNDILMKNIFAQAPECSFDEPWQESFFSDFELQFNANKDEIAAVIIEPIVQGTGGMNFYSPVFLRKLSEFCKANDVLLIADEIATGFGRTGKLFACEHAKISPDILCLGKALTGGYLSMAATLCSDAVAEQICSAAPGVFMHGPTFMANPLACAIAQCSIDLLLEDNILEGNALTRVAKIELQLKSELVKCRDLDCVKEVRVLGAIGVVELKQAVDMKIIQPMFVAQGLWVRPFGRLVYIMPPYITSKKDLSVLIDGIFQVLTQYQGTNLERACP
ncbi:MAG: adenosylmethionine--8-amino-7-oxononanoate transaminase [Alteromonadaceae bacterium]|nr:MAG: adenosylmethionine--8-amino-7-oxononanoate transaminase [Alteromonadaceae bacterium]